MNKKKKAPYEFGKLMTFFIISFFMINFEAIIIASFVLMFMTGDSTPLNEMLIGIFATVGAIIGPVMCVYQWKTKAINTLKIKQAAGLKIYDNDVTESGNFEKEEG